MNRLKIECKNKAVCITWGSHLLLMGKPFTDGWGWLYVDAHRNGSMKVWKVKTA